jgi:hypothetical protein
MSRPRAATTSPSFTSDRLQLLGPLITPAALALARWRVAGGQSMFHRDRLRATIPPEQGRIALILVLEMNPRTLLDTNEQGLLRGVGRKAYTTMLEAGEIEQ